MKKILLLGNGGREHAIVKALSSSPQKTEIYGFFSAKNPKITELCTSFFICTQKNFGEESGFMQLQEFAQENAVDFAVLGPDDPIGAGAADALKAVGIPSFGPTKKAAQLESSKGFTRDIIEKYGINGNPQFYRFAKPANTVADIERYLKNIDYEYVIKDDGLCGGKGVFVQGDHFNTALEGIDIAQKILEDSGSLVIEEKLYGPEFSLMCIVDGKTVIPSPPIADHKRAYEGDTGPNTGGMGTVSTGELLPFCTKENIAEAVSITQKIMEAVQKETGEPFVGVMYGGFMRTKTGVKVIEYNARFGDPEALNFFTLLQSDFVEICTKAIEEQLNTLDIAFSKNATVCKYLVPNGYPTNAEKHSSITVDASKIPEGVEVFYASVYEDEEGVLRLGGSRAIGVVGIDEDFETAAKKANAALLAVQGNVWAREDIGTKALLQSRVKMVEGV